MNHSNITLELTRQAAAAPDGVALILSDAEISYANLDRLVWSAATHLHDAGVRAGDVTGVTLRHELARVLCTLGLMRLGATVLPLARSLTEHQRQELVSSLGVRHLVSDAPATSGSTAMALRFDLGALRSQSSIKANLLCEEPPGYCLLVPGSGSTGKPKIIPQSHRVLRDRIALAFPNPSDGEQERVLSLTNLEFSAGINRLLSVIGRGGAFAVADRHMASLGAYCHEKRITTLFASVFHAESLLQSLPQEGPLLLPGLKALRISGSAVSLSLRTRIRDRLSPHLHLIYGANECGRISLATPPAVFDGACTVGRPLRGVQVEIVDTAGTVLPAGARGLIRVRTPSLIPAYVNDPEATRKYFRDGWFYTGDVGAWLADGSLQVFGRSDGMMIMNGVNIFPAEIEQAIRELPGVRDVVVVAARFAVHQDVPVAAVALAARSTLDAAGILELAKARLGFRAPREVVILDDIPRSPHGKVQGEQLRKLIQASRGRVG